MDWCLSFIARSDRSKSRAANFTHPRAYIWGAAVVEAELVMTFWDWVVGFSRPCREDAPVPSSLFYLMHTL